MAVGKLIAAAAAALMIVATIESSTITSSHVLVNSRLEISVESLLSEICGVNSSLLSISLKSLSSEFSDRTVEHLCAEQKTTSVLLWIPTGNFGDLSDTGSSKRYLGKSIGDEEFAEYCSYDVTTNKCATVNGGVDGVVLLLAEKYPERYELRDLVFKKWTNTTRLGSPLLAYATLKNRDPAYRYVDQDISYLADTRVEYILPDIVAHGVSLSVYRGKTETNKLITGETYYSRNFKTINAIRYMSPYSTINITVMGSEGRDYREFRGKLVTVYSDEEGYGWSKLLAAIDGAMIETKLTETHVEYAQPVNLYDTQPPEAGNKVGTNSEPQPIKAKSENIHIHINEFDLGQVYPGFRSFAIGAAILVFSVLGIALIDIIRRIVANHRAKRLRIGKYSRT